MSEHELWNELGNLYFMAGTYNQAAYAYNRSIQLDAGFGRPYCNLALTYVKQGRFADAVQLYQRSIELLVDEKEKAITWYRLGDVYRHLKDYRDAILAYQQADLLDAEMSQERKDSDQVLYGTSEIELPPEFIARAAEQIAAPVQEIVAPAVQEPEPTPEPEAAELEPMAELEAVEPELPQEAAPLIEEQPVETVQQVEELAIVEPLVVEIDVVEDELEAAPADELELAPAEEVDETPQAAEEAPEISMAVAEEAPADEPVREPEQMQVDVAPVIETMSEMVLPGPAGIDDEELYSTFEHETEFYIPDYTDEQLEQWLPIPEPEGFENEPNAGIQRLIEDRLQLEPEPNMPRREWRELQRQPEAAVQDVCVEELSMPPVAQLEIDIHEDELADVFIIPGEQAVELEPAPELQAATEAQPAAELETPVETQPVHSMQDACGDIEGLEEIEAEITKFKHVVQKNPRNAPGWDTLGTLYKSARRYRDALMAYQQAVAVDPSKAAYHHHLGIIYAIEGREEDAMKAFQDVIQLDPNHSLANATLGGYYRKMGLDELAQRHIGKAMKNFYNSENEYNRACLEALCGNIEQSIELLRIALKNKQTYVDWVLRDPDLDSIRRDPRFKQLISDYTL
jgi:tetratricopeptide (TPR) repeat protein